MQGRFEIEHGSMCETDGRSRQEEMPFTLTMEVPDSALIDSSIQTATTDDDDIAFAAEAAANAVEAADAEQQRLDLSLLTCRICGQGIIEGRPLLRFLPVDHDLAAAHAAPSVMTFGEDICLHIFCGKTASILPSVNQPELEILTKAGLKNKHGIGPEVNAALARTRCAIFQQDGTKEKHYFLVREFEAHLAAIRHTHISFVSEGNDSNHEQQHQQQHQNQNGGPMVDPFHQDSSTDMMRVAQELINPPMLQEPPQQHSNHFFNPSKPVPVRAAAGMVSKPRSSNSRLDQPPPPVPQNLTEEGKVRCGCGGTHWPAGTPRGASSWRNHAMTKRHQKWMETQGLLGEV